MGPLLRRFCLAAVLLALLPDVSIAQTNSQTGSAAIPLSSEFKPAPYVLGPQDKVKVVFFGLTPGDAVEMNREYEVQADGTILLKHVGSVKVEGLTELAARDEIRKALVPRIYPESLKVDVTVSSERMQEVMVHGQVNRPGAQQLPGSLMTVLRAISQAGGFNTSAGQEVDVRRGDKLVFSVTRTELDAGNDPQILAGDSITVRTAQKVFVNGEVVASGAKTWEPGMTVGRAISLSGGMNSKGKLGKIRRPVIQKDGSIKYIEIKGGKLKMETMLEPNDELYIARKWFGGI